MYCIPKNLCPDSVTVVAKLRSTLSFGTGTILKGEGEIVLMILILMIIYTLYLKKCVTEGAIG